MKNIIRFRKVRHRTSKNRWQPRFLYVWVLVFAAAFATSLFLSNNSEFRGFESGSQKIQPQTPVSVSFYKCGSGSRVNCVVDGDTFYLDGYSIRIADIDTPETYNAKCSYEKNLGDRATRRLTQLLNEGDFELKPIMGRDEDQYGRKLRTVIRDGQSLGKILVSEGLARNWEGRRRSWCT